MVNFIASVANLHSAYITDGFVSNQGQVMPDPFRWLTLHHDYLPLRALYPVVAELLHPFLLQTSAMKPASVASPHGCYVEAEFSTFDQGLSKLTVSTSQKLAGRLPKRDGGACGFADDARASCTSVQLTRMKSLRHYTVGQGQGDTRSLVNPLGR